MAAPQNFCLGEDNAILFPPSHLSSRSHLFSRFLGAPFLASPVRLLFASTRPETKRIPRRNKETRSTQRKKEKKKENAITDFFPFPNIPVASPPSKWPFLDRTLPRGKADLRGAFPRYGPLELLSPSRSESMQSCSNRDYTVKELIESFTDAGQFLTLYTEPPLRQPPTERKKRTPGDIR